MSEKAHAGRNKRIVFTTWGSYGDVHPHMALALDLQGRGHRPVIATSEIYREKIEAEGLGFFPVRPELPDPTSEEARRMIRELSDSVFGPIYIFRELLMPHIRATYEDTLAAVEADGGADLLVSHQVPLAAPIVAEKTGVKWISSVLFPIAFASIYDPPTPPQFPFMREVVKLHPLIGRALMDLGKWSMTWFTEPVQTLRTELGLERGANPVFDAQHSPRLVLALFSEIFGPRQQDFPPQSIITGFPFYDRNDVGQTLDPRLEEFLEDGQRPILFTLGSSLVWLDSDFYQMAIEAAVRLGRRAILLTGDNRNLPDNLPAGIEAFDYAPHHLVMPRVECTVHQGGIGTTAQALRSGRPMLVVPHGQDQPDNARRCVELGVARSIAAPNLSVDSLVQELSKLISDPEFSKRAATVGAHIRSESGTSTACDLIEKHLGEPSR